MAEHKILTSDTDIERALQSASHSGEPTLTALDLAENEDGRMLSLKISDGSRHLIPVNRVEGLSGAPSHEILRFEITEDGLGVHWPGLDLDLYVPELLQGMYGTKKWMSSLGKRGGSSRSAAKCRAARENGRKGGRPRKRRLSQSSTNVRQATHPTYKGPSWGDSMWYTSLPLRDGTLRHTRADFAFVFGLDESTSSRPLPRIS